MSVGANIGRISFWGTFFILVLTIYFNVSVSGLITDAFNANIPLNILSALLIISVLVFIVYIVITIALEKKAGGTVFDAIAIESIDTRTPFDIFVLFQIPSLAEGEGKGGLINRFILAVLWWVAVLYGGYAAINTPGSALANATYGMYYNQFYIKLAIVAGLIIALRIISAILLKIFSIKCRKMYAHLNTNEYQSMGTKRQQYYENNPQRIPNACSACGGPYPECKASCSLFDD